MALVFNIKTGALRSTKRELPSMFAGKNRNIRRYRLIGGGSPPECDNSICNGTVSCIKNKPSDCVLQVTC